MTTQQIVGFLAILATGASAYAAIVSSWVLRYVSSIDARTGRIEGILIERGLK